MVSEMFVGRKFYGRMYVS